VTRPTNNVLTWLRQLVTARGLGTAELAERSGIVRGRLRKLLSGSEPMLVDELLQISQALELSATDLGWPEGAIPEPDDAGADEPPADEDEGAIRLVPLDSDPPAATFEVDPYGNPTEQIVRLAFELGCTVLFWAHVDQLDDSGVPEHVIADHREQGQLLISLDAKFHRYNNPVFQDDGLTLTLSFDQLYDCTFPWSAIHKVIFDLEQEGDTGDTPGRPHLRLVT